MDGYMLIWLYAYMTICLYVLGRHFGILMGWNIDECVIVKKL